MEITLRTRQPSRQFLTVELLDSAGKPVEWNTQSYSYSEDDEDGQPGMIERSLTIGLHEKLEKVDVVVHYYGDVQQVKLPFSVECGVAVESIAEH